MMKIESIKKILSSGESVSVNHMVNELKIPKRTIQKILYDNKDIFLVSGTGKNTTYYLSEEDIYFNVPYNFRNDAKYNYKFICNYSFNNKFLSSEQLNVIHNECDKYSIEKDNNTLSTFAKNLHKAFIVDLSYASSKFEGNTYDYLDTQVLIEHGTVNDKKTVDEANMIINHKSAICYILDNVDNIDLSIKTLKDVHSLLSQNLVRVEDEGKIRDRIVNILGSAYTPIDNFFQLNEQLELVFDKVNKIDSPYEQSLFLLGFVSYLQSFIDVNKRTARLMANIPLIKNGLPPLSFIDINKKDYTKALLSFYELNNADLLSCVFTKAIVKSGEKYMKNLNDFAPNITRLKYKEEIKKIAQLVIVDGEEINKSIRCYISNPSEKEKEFIKYLVSNITDNNCVAYDIPHDIFDKRNKPIVIKK